MLGLLAALAMAASGGATPDDKTIHACPDGWDVGANPDGWEVGSVCKDPDGSTWTWDGKGWVPSGYAWAAGYPDIY